MIKVYTLSFSLRINNIICIKVFNTNINNKSNHMINIKKTSIMVKTNKVSFYFIITIIYIFIINYPKDELIEETYEDGSVY